MQYNGHELKEITEPHIFDPPKEMLVWDDEFTHCYKETVCAITNYSVFVINKLNKAEMFEHCAEIPEEPKPRRATNRELSKWLAEGKGECKCSNGYTDTAWNYEFYDETVPDYAKVRRWDDTEWHEPTADYLGLEADK